MLVTERDIEDAREEGRERGRDRGRDRRQTKTGPGLSHSLSLVLSHRVRVKARERRGTINSFLGLSSGGDKLGNESESIRGERIWKRGNEGGGPEKERECERVRE